MEEVRLSVREWYEVQSQLLGLQQGKEIIYTGFVNEKDITEGTKRIAYRMGNAIVREMKPIFKQRDEINVFVPEGDTSALDLDAIRTAKREELFDSVMPIMVEKLDFNKVKDSKLSMNYQFIYERVFTE